MSQSTPIRVRDFGAPSRVAKSNRERGSQIAEFAEILPLLFMLLYGIFWFGRAFNTYETITRAAREAARMAAAPTCATCGNAFYSKASLRATCVDPILRADHLNPDDMTDANFLVTTGVSLNPITNPGGTQNSMGDMGTVVTIAYPMRFPLYTLQLSPLGIKKFNAGITLTTTVQMREEH